MKHILTLLLLLATSIASAESTLAKTYFCIGEKKTGYRAYSDWRSDTGKYIIKEAEIYKSNKYEIYEHGTDNIIATCKTAVEGRVIRCKNLGDGDFDQFNIHPETLRFMYFYSGSYLHREEVGNDVSIEIGTCSKI